MFRAILLASATLLTVTSASAQEDVLAEMYGRGVHHYHSGNYIDAHRYLTMAIDNGTRDPRPYFFRGLVHDVTGRLEEAEADYRTGAMLEAQGSTGTLVGRALARVQGSRRLEIERIREETQLEVKINQQAQARARYEAREASEAQTLRNRPRAPQAVPPPSPDATTSRPAPTPADDSRSNPFADDGETAGGAPTVEAEDALGDPLAEEEARTEDTAPATPPATPSDDDGDVFNLGDGDSGDIFGSGMDDDEPADDDADAPADDDDPFDF